MENPDHFIRANTRLLAPPLVPEIVLHLAAESLPIWQKTEEELGEINVPPPYWAFAWAGGQALARFLLDRPELVAGCRVLDLGSGSGLTAIAAAKSHASDVLANDIDRVSLAAVRLNAEANSAVVATSGADLLAGGYGGGNGPSSHQQPFQTILVGDLFYERQLAGLVLAYVEEAAAHGATILIGDPQRAYFPKDRFAMAAEYRVPVTRELEDSEIKRTAVWRL